MKRKNKDLVIAILKVVKYLAAALAGYLTNGIVS